MKKYDIIITGIQPWDYATEGNCLNIAKTFAKDQRVLFVNYPLDRSLLMREKETQIVQNRLNVINGKSPQIEQIDENLWVFTPPIVLLSANWLPTPIFRVVNNYNNRVFAKFIMKAVNKLGFKDLMLFCDSDMYRSNRLKKLIKPDLFVYYTRDNLMTVPYWYKHGHKLEPELMKSSHLVVANSPHLEDMAKQHNSNSFYVGQGCDLSNFEIRNTAPPADLSQIKGLKVGYIGLLTGRRLNIELLVDMVKKRKDLQLVLVGPEEEDFQKSELHQIENVHFLGTKGTDELSNYMEHFDVCINPQIINDLTVGNYPRKIDEYLAMGKPTVATDTPTMRIFSEHVYLGKTCEDYIRLIEKAIRENSPNKEAARRKFAQSHTWENNVKAIRDAIRNTIEISGLKTT